MAKRTKWPSFSVDAGVVLFFGVLLGVGSAAGCTKREDGGAGEEPGLKSPLAADEVAEKESAELPDRDPSLARRLVKEEGALLLDVRSAGEYEAGHLEGAVLIPHDALTERLAEVLEKQGGDKDKPIVLYCGSGRRAGIAKEELKRAGFTRVTNLGGMSDWCDGC